MTQTHRFGNGRFEKELWIAGKRVFKELKSVDVEFEVGGVWQWVIADSSGTIVKIKDSGSPGSWTSIDLPSLGLYGDYSIGFKSQSAGVKVIKQGDVNYG